MIFWDGVGYGKKNPATNPFFNSPLPALTKIFDGIMPSLLHKRIETKFATVSPVNATLGVAGFPQSGTGQIALFTGVNAPKFIGKHFGPYPYSTLLPVLREQNLFLQLERINKTSNFVNCYPQRYFDYLKSPKGKMPTVAYAFTSLNRTLHTHIELKTGNAISADIVGSRWKELGHADIEATTAYEAGKNFHRIGKQYDFTLFEYWITDDAGHSQKMDIAVDVLVRMDGFISGILHSFDFENDTLLMISDHGNIEDLSTKSHTRNAVPLIVLGKGKKYFSKCVKRLTDVTPAIVKFIFENTK